MKFYSFFLSFFLFVVPVYGYAFLPVAVNVGTAIAGSTVGRVAITTASGTAIKKISPTSFTNLTKNGLATCIKNGIGCSAVITAMKKDGINIDVDIDNSKKNDIDVQIYREPDNDVCYTVNSEIRNRLTPKRTKRMACSQLIGMSYQSTNGWNIRYTQVRDFLADNGKVCVIEVIQSKDSQKHDNYENLNYIELGCNGADKDYLTDDEIDDYIKKHATDDDVTNIYNYDYSQHENITINNRTEQGDKINKYKNDFDDDEKDKRVSERATEKIKKKDKDYDIDGINEKNCDKNEEGEYDKCGKDRDEKDDDDDEEEENKDDEEEKKDDDNDLVDCKASEFHKKICKFIDDMDEFLDDTEDTDTRLKKSDDDEKPVSTKISFGGGCPPNTVININYLGISKNIVLFDSVRFCEFLDDFVKPSVVVISSLWAVYILRGSNNV